MSLPTRNFWHQRQEQVTEEEEENRYRHVHNKQNPNHLVPVSKYEVAELTWEKGNLNMHRLGGIVLNDQTKQTFGRASDTLESIVHQATSNKQNYSPSNLKGGDQNQANISTGNIATSSGQWRESSAVKQQTTAGLVRKRMRSDSDPQLYGSGRSVGECSKNIVIDQQTERSANCDCDRDNDTTMITWPCSLDESSRSFKSKANEDSGWHGRPENKEKEHETKGSNPSKRNRTAAVHNQSERRRRDRINEKLKTLQKMVPNASKTDKASMLDEVIKYLKLLQTEVQLISSARNMEYSQMMMMQPHIQMPLLARMGMNSLGMAPGMLNMAALARAATPHQSLTAPFIYPTSSIATSCPPFMSPAFAMAPTVPTPPQASGDACANKAAVAPSATNSFPFNDPYSAFLAQSMNMEFNNEMAAQYLQQANQSMHTRSKKLNQGNFNQGQTSDEKSRI